MRKKKRLPILLISTVLLVVGAAVYFYLGSNPWKKKQPKYETAAVTKGDVVARVTATGNLQAVTQVTVGSQVSGIVQALYVDFNSRVKKGQALAQLDPSTFRAQVEQTTASVNNALSQLANQQANLGNAGANVRSAEAAVTSAQAKVETARAALANAQAALSTSQANLRKGQADLVLASRNQQRQQSLRSRDLIAASDLDTAATSRLTAQASVEALQAQIEGAKANYRSALANVDSAKAEVQAARMRVDAALQQQAAARAQVQGAKAQVSQAQANLRQAQVNLGWTTIRSPIDGIVLDRKVEVGQTVAAQFQAPDLFTMAENLEQIRVQTSVDEADIGQVHKGQRAVFTVDAYPNERFRGVVTEVRQAPVTVQSVVTYTVIIQTSNPDGKLKPGMTANVNINVDSRRDVLLVPNQALRFRPPTTEKDTRTPRPRWTPGERPRERVRQSTVYTLDPSHPEKLIEHKITPGLSDGVNTEIVKGDLKEGDVVVTASESDAAKSTPSSGGGPGRRGPPGMRMF